MDTRTAIAVIAGLSVGIGLIITFALIFNHPFNRISSSNPMTNTTIWEPTYHVNLTIAGLKDSYRVGEPITFTITVSGYGYYCQTPNSWIWNASSPNANGLVWRSGLPSILCLEQNIGSNPVYHSINDNYPYLQDRNITIDEPGKYVLGARIRGDPAVQKEFTVTG